MRAVRISPVWKLALLAAAATFAAPASAAFSFHAEAVCIDDGVVKQGIEGGIAAPSASCSYSVNRGGLNRRAGSAAASAQGIAGARAVGVEVAADATLADTFVPTVFGANALASARIEDIFIPIGTLPAGIPVSNGLMDIHAVATGQIRLDAQGAATINTRAFLNYAIAVGGAGTSATELVFLGDLAPGETRVINVPFVIPAVPFVNGLAITVQMAARAELFAELEHEGSIDGRIQFGNSLDWLGIANVTDAAGAPLAGFAAISPDTGTDWSTLSPVPEPAAWALLLGGLGAVLIATRPRGRGAIRAARARAAID
jgi:hypothetical protein